MTPFKFRAEIKITKSWASEPLIFPPHLTADPQKKKQATVPWLITIMIHKAIRKQILNDQAKTTKHNKKTKRNLHAKIQDNCLQKPGLDYSNGNSNESNTSKKWIFVIWQSCMSWSPIIYRSCHSFPHFPHIGKTTGFMLYDFYLIFPVWVVKTSHQKAVMFIIFDGPRLSLHCSRTASQGDTKLSSHTVHLHLNQVFWCFFWRDAFLNHHFDESIPFDSGEF